MRKCNRCNLNIVDDTEVCPLCEGVLEAETDKGISTYPNVVAGRRRIVFLRRLLFFLGLVTIAICVFINYHTPHRYWWSVVVAVIILYGLRLFFLLTNPESGYRSRVIFGVFGALFGVILIDFVTGYRGWSVNYVLPATIFFINLILIVLMIINSRNWQSYMVYQLGSIIIAAVPVGLIYAGVVTVPMLSELAFGSCVFLFLGTLILGGRVARTELARRFHI